MLWYISYTLLHARLSGLVTFKQGHVNTHTVMHGEVCSFLMVDSRFINDVGDFDSVVLVYTVGIVWL